MSLHTELRSYLWFCRWIFPRSYSIKFLAIAFVGIHVPLITYVVYLAVRHGVSESLPDLLVVLLATLGGTALTLWMQYELLSPIRVTAGALQAYQAKREIWSLPSDAPDQAGDLMHRTQECLRDLDQLMRLKDSLAAGIAHDFRNPLTGLSLTAEALLTDPLLTAEQRRHVEAMRRTTDAQLRQITGLLEAVLDETRNANFAVGKIRVEDLWADVRSMLGAVAEHRKVRLGFEGTDAMIAGDRARITQVLNNLTSNALKATPTGGHVTLGAERITRGWKLVVRDSGVGLDSKQISMLLNAGKHPEAENAKLGLGLRMTNSLLRLHASRLAISSAPGHGAEFSFVLEAA